MSILPYTTVHVASTRRNSRHRCDWGIYWRGDCNTYNVQSLSSCDVISSIININGSRCSCSCVGDSCGKVVGLSQDKCYVGSQGCLFLPRSDVNTCDILSWLVVLQYNCSVCITHSRSTFYVLLYVVKSYVWICVCFCLSWLFCTFFLQYSFTICFVITLDFLKSEGMRNVMCYEY